MAKHLDPRDPDYADVEANRTLSRNKIARPVLAVAGGGHGGLGALMVD